MTHCIKHSTIMMIILTILGSLGLCLNDARAFTVRVYFTAEFSDHMQYVQWRHLDEQEVKDLIVDKITDKFSPFGISVSTSTGDIAVSIGHDYTGTWLGWAPIGTFQDPSNHIGEVYSWPFSQDDAWKGDNATKERISTGIASTAAHELGHILTCEHAYMFDSFDPTISGALDGNGYPKEWDDLPGAATTDTTQHYKVMSTHDDNITNAQRACIDRVFGVNSTQAIRFAINGGYDVSTSLAFGLRSSTTTFAQQQNFTISSGKTLILAGGGYSYDFNGYGAILPSGTAIQKYGTVYPDNELRVRFLSGSNEITYGHNIQGAIDAASSGQTVYLMRGESYAESFELKSNVHMAPSTFGSGDVSLSGTVEFNSVSGNNVSGIKFGC